MDCSPLVAKALTKTMALFVSDLN